MMVCFKEDALGGEPRGRWTDNSALQFFIMYVCMLYNMDALGSPYLSLCMLIAIQGSLPHGGITRSE